MLSCPDQRGQTNTPRFPTSSHFLALDSLSLSPLSPSTPSFVVWAEVWKTKRRPLQNCYSYVRWVYRLPLQLQSGTIHSECRSEGEFNPTRCPMKGKRGVTVWSHCSRYTVSHVSNYQLLPLYRTIVFSYNFQQRKEKDIRIIYLWNEYRDASDTMFPNMYIITTITIHVLLERFQLISASRVIMHVIMRYHAC